MWQPSVERFSTLQAPGLWASLTGDLRGQKPINCGPLQMLIMLAQMIVVVSPDGQS